MNPQQAWKAKLEGALFLGVHNCKKIVWTVNHGTGGNLQATPLKKLPFWCEFPTLLIQIKRGVTWRLPWCFLPSTAATHYSILCTAIDKEGCYLEVTLVLPYTVAMCYAALGNLQVTPLVIYSNVHIVHCTAKHCCIATSKTHTISSTFQGNLQVTPRGVTWRFPSVT